MGHAGAEGFLQTEVGRWAAVFLGTHNPRLDEKGRLFSFGAGDGSSVPNFTPPPGQDILTSSDVQECATESQKKVGPTGG